MAEIYYHPLSFPSLGPVFMAEAAGIEYTTKLVDLTQGEQSSPEYLEVNPYGKVPALKEGDFTMAESAAIMRYLARSNNSALYPSDPKEQATCDQWMDFVNHHIRTNVNNFPVIEQTLLNQPYLCGDNMTLADIALVAALEPSDMSKIDMSEYPALTKWLAERRSEAFYTNVHSHYGAELGM